MFSSMVPKNNPLFLRYSRSCKYVGLDSKRSSQDGFCRFSDISFGLLAAAMLFMVTYRKQGIVTYGQILQRFDINPITLDRFVSFPFDIPHSISDFSDLIYQIALKKCGTGYVLSHRISIDLIAGVIKSHDLEPFRI